MKFIFADSLDFVDPNFDFESDEFGPGRKVYWDDQFPHEILGQTPYDGILVSRATVGDHLVSGKYTEAQAMRFRRDGARKFLRFDGPENKTKPLFGDCGAFSYHKLEKPPYTADDTLEFYHQGGFTHGFSVDHVIFEFDERFRDMTGGSEVARERFEITQGLAEEFLIASKQMGNGFTPIGVAQGWSPGSTAHAARSLVEMGYTYIALGGLVPLRTRQIHMTLQAVLDALPNAANTAIHLLGFAKADQIDEFKDYGIASFDSTSPLIRAFKDARRNYYLPAENGTLTYFGAIRIPQALENPKLKRHCQEGRYLAEDLQRLEKDALSAMRLYSQGAIQIDDAIEALIRYARPLIDTGRLTEQRISHQLALQEAAYRNTLQARPWTKCNCRICEKAGIDVVIFRGSNRNKRRGIHNLRVFYDHVKTLN